MPEEMQAAGCGAAHHVHRRSALKSMALGSVAVLALAQFPAMASAVTGETLTQEGWRRCRKCRILFFSMDQAAGWGVCAAGGSHVPSRPFHLVRMGPELAKIQQAGWSWCMRCMALYSRYGNDMGACPAGGAHNNYSGGYAAVFETRGGDRQIGWRWCRKCLAMFQAEPGGGSGGGICPRDHRAHDGSTSLHYGQLIDPNG